MRLAAKAGRAASLIDRLYESRRPGRGILAALLLGLASMVEVLAASSPATADKLIRSARQLELAQTAQWRALLHYEPRWLSRGSGSIITNPWFFLAEDGATNAVAELEATINRLVSGRVLEPWNKPAQCVFPARAAFLRERLKLPHGTFSSEHCSEYQRWRNRLSASSVSLVFPAAYLNSPASMFGHTLLRLDGDGESSQELLAFAVNFAANTGRNTGGF